MAHYPPCCWPMGQIQPNSARGQRHRGQVGAHGRRGANDSPGVLHRIMGPQQVKQAEGPLPRGGESRQISKGCSTEGVLQTLTTHRLIRQIHGLLLRVGKQTRCCHFSHDSVQPVGKPMSLYFVYWSPHKITVFFSPTTSLLPPPWSSSPFCALNYQKKIRQPSRCFE